MGLAYWLHLNGRVLFVVFELIGAAFILCACDVVHWVKKTCGFAELTATDLGVSLYLCYRTGVILSVQPFAWIWCWKLDFFQ